MRLIRAITSLLIGIMIIPGVVFSASWNSAVTTTGTINPASGTCLQEDYAEMDVFANVDGLHLLVKDDDGIKYRRYNTSGSVQTTSTISSSGEFPNVTGDNDNLYIAYYDDDSLFVKKSTNNGSTWSSNAYYALLSADCIGIDIALDDNDLHVVYGFDGEVRYRKLNNGSWSNYYTVSSDGSAGNPSIALSSNRIHVSWHTNASQYYCNNGDEKTRDKYSGTWQTIQNPADDGVVEFIVTDDNDLHMFYYVDAPLIHRLKHLSRGVSSTIWSSETAIGSTDLVGSATFEVADFTTDGTLHLIASEDEDELDHFTYDGSSWSAGSEITSGTTREWHAMTANSNDVYVFWAKSGGANVDTIEYRQYDAVPTKPTGVSVSGSSGQNPTVSWNANPETDMSTYYVYRNVVWDRYTQTGWQYQTSTSNTSWTDPNFQVGGLISVAYYKIKAKDVGNNYSSYSSTVSIAGAPGMGAKITATQLPEEYYLSAAYPNPFNPSTTISYSLPLASSVSIQVFDVGGHLISEHQTANQLAGKYEFTWNGRTNQGMSVPSGLYIIKMQALGVEERDGYEGATQIQTTQKVMLLK